jgi:hypothetical protein
MGCMGVWRRLIDEGWREVIGGRSLRSKPARGEYEVLRFGYGERFLGRK